MTTNEIIAKVSCKQTIDYKYKCCVVFPPYVSSFSYAMKNNISMPYNELSSILLNPRKEGDNIDTPYIPRAILLGLPNELADIIYSYLYETSHSQQDNSRHQTVAKHQRFRRKLEDGYFTFCFERHFPCLNYRLVSKAAATSFVRHLSEVPGNRNTWECSLLFDVDRQGPLIRWIKSFCTPDHVRNLTLNLVLVNLGLLDSLTHQRSMGPGSFVLRDTFRILDMILYRGANIGSARVLRRPIMIDNLTINLTIPNDSSVGEDHKLSSSSGTITHSIPDTRNIMARSEISYGFRDNLKELISGGFFLQRINHMSLHCAELDESWHYVCRNMSQSCIPTREWEQPGYR